MKWYLLVYNFVCPILNFLFNSSFFEGKIIAVIIILFFKSLLCARHSARPYRIYYITLQSMYHKPILQIRKLHPRLPIIGSPVIIPTQMFPNPAFFLFHDNVFWQSYSLEIIIRCIFIISLAFSRT